MRRMGRRRVSNRDRRIRLMSVAAGGLLVTGFLILMLLSLEGGSTGEGGLPLIQDSGGDTTIKPGNFIFYDALKKPEAEGLELMPLVPKKPVMKEPADPPIPPVRPKPPKGQPDLNQAYAVQVGAFPDLQSADKLTQDLKNKGYNAYYRDEEIPGKGRWFRVRVGHYNRRDEAISIANRIKEREDLKGFVVLERR